MKKDKTQKKWIEKLREWRGERTQKIVAESLGLSERGYRCLERGEHPIRGILKAYLIACDEIRELRATIRKITGLES